jgi:hypothetical protein
LIRAFHGRLAALVALLLLTSSANAGTVLQFTQANPADTVSAVQSGSSTTLVTTGNADGAGVSVPVTITNYNGTPGLNIPAFETFVNVTSVGPATTFGSFVMQAFSGSIVFSVAPGGAGGSYLTVTFSDATLFGSGSSLTFQTGSNSMVMYSYSTPGFISDLYSPSFSLSFSNVAPPVSTTDGTLSSFSGQQTGTFSATAIPEPSTVVMGAFPLVVGLLISFKRMRK